jgi:hypothetical protein
MKTTFLAMILACTLAAGALNAQQPAQPGTGGGAAQGGGQAAPEIKDPNEYNAYVNAIQQKDPTGKISALEAFLTQYPNSVMKTTAMELLMNTYLQAQNQPKVLDTAQRLLQADACNLRALALLTYLSRQSVSAGQGMPQSLSDLTKYANKGLECTSSGQKPAGMSQDDYDKLKKQTAAIFEGGAGFACLQNKDYACAQKNLSAAIEADPNDLQNVYPLAMSYLSDPKAVPPDTDKLGEKGLCYIARAANLATGAGQAQIQDYGRKKYKNYHGSEDGWNGVLLATKSAPFTCPSISVYVPPTPEQQACDLVKDKTPDQIKQLSFGEWELVLNAGKPECQDKVWSVIKGIPLQMEGQVVSAHDQGEGAEKATVIQIAASEDDIEKKQADITLTMTGVIAARQMPKAGDTLDFEGTPTDYVSAVHQGSGASPTAGAATAPAAASTTPATDTAQPGADTATAAAAGQTAPSTTGAAPAAGAPAVPFMMTMEKGKLLTKAGAPKKTTAAPARRRTTTRKPQ